LSSLYILIISPLLIYSWQRFFFLILFFSTSIWKPFLWLYRRFLTAFSHIYWAFLFITELTEFYWGSHCLCLLLPMFSLLFTVLVSGLVLTSLFHFELILVQVHKDRSSFCSVHVDIQYSQQHFLKRLSFLHPMFFVSLSKISCEWLCRFISGSSILSHWS
jgi:hypothetical protein